MGDRIVPNKIKTPLAAHAIVRGMKNVSGRRMRQRLREKVRLEICDEFLSGAHYLSHSQMTRLTEGSLMMEGLESLLLTELKCPVCDNFMAPPINQCQIGHTFCYDCFRKLEFCPICQSQKDPFARCWVLEKIYAKLTTIPCKNSFAGCHFVCNGSDIERHQENCEFRCRPCPFRYYDDCSWQNIYSKLETHLTTEHSSNFYKERYHMLVAHNIKNLNTYDYTYVVISAYNELFRLTWDFDESTGMTRWAVYFLGRDEDAKKYSFKLQFTLLKENEDEQITSMVFKSPCTAAPDDDSVEFVEHQYFLINRCVLEKYCKEDGNLNYEVSIYSVIMHN